MSTDLQWLLVRKYNSFMRPARNGPVFSAEKVSIDSGQGQDVLKLWDSEGQQAKQWDVRDGSWRRGCFCALWKGCSECSEQ